jgi:hypothetical protein
MHSGHINKYFIRGEILDILGGDYIVLIINSGVQQRHRLPHAHRTHFLRLSDNTFCGDILFEKLAVFPVKDLVINTTIQLPVQKAFENFLGFPKFLKRYIDIQSS